MAPNSLRSRRYFHMTFSGSVSSFRKRRACSNRSLGISRCLPATRLNNSSCSSPLIPGALPEREEDREDWLGAPSSAVRGVERASSSGQGPLIPIPSPEGEGYFEGRSQSPCFRSPSPSGEGRGEGPIATRLGRNTAVPRWVTSGSGPKSCDGFRSLTTRRQEDCFQKPKRTGSSTCSVKKPSISKGRWR